MIWKTMCYFGAGSSAVHDSVAPVHWERILEAIKTLSSNLITRINNPAIGLGNLIEIHLNNMIFKFMFTLNDLSFTHMSNKIFKWFS